MKKIILTLVLAVTALFGNARNGGTRPAGNGDADPKCDTVRYFASFGGLKQKPPVRLYNELDPSALKKRKTYLKAIRRGGLLTVVEKYLDGALFFRLVYTYNGDRLTRAEMFDGEGKMKQEFDY